MFETQSNPAHEAILRRAHALRAQAFRDVFAAVLGLFRLRRPTRAVAARA